MVADVTVDYYSILTTTATNPSPAPTYVMGATVEGIASVSVQADGETVYAETVVATLDAIVSGTSTLTTVFSTPTTTVCKPPAAVLPA